MKEVNCHSATQHKEPKNNKTEAASQALANYTQPVMKHVTDETNPHTEKRG